MRLSEGGYDEEAPLVVNDGTGLAEALLGLSRFRIMAVTEGPTRW